MATGVKTALIRVAGNIKRVVFLIWLSSPLSK
jgi:hypothetical protein